MHEIRVGSARYGDGDDDVIIGAAGAIWGSGQVYLLRYDARESVDNPWIDWAMVVGVLGIVRYLILYFNTEQIDRFRSSIKLYAMRDISLFKALIMAMEIPFGAVVYAVSGHAGDTYTPMP